MSMIRSEKMLFGLVAMLLVGPLSAQTDLPRVTVTAPAASAYTSHHGGYLISGDFKVDPRMPYVAFPAQALVQDDILSIQPVNLADDEYLVLQECASADCSQARIVRVWNTGGATSIVQNSENRIWIKHENKYFVWLKRLPEVSGMSQGGCGIHFCSGRGSHFDSFESFSPPLTLIPNGELAAHNGAALQLAENANPVAVESQEHEGATYVLTFVGGSKIRIKRMHSVE